MSKMDNQRAMREAKFARTQARATGVETREPRPPVAPAASTTPQAPLAAHGNARCGHRSMNGRTCTRDSGHGEKSHRYG